jgi:hypothetical protein
MSSGKYKSHHGFNPIQIKDGMVVRLRKDGRIQSVLGKVGEYKKNGPKTKEGRGSGLQQA